MLGSFMAVRSPESFHVARIDESGLCTAMEPIGNADIWFNAGFFAFRHEIFDYIHDGEDLVVEPFKRLIDARQLLAYRYDGFWQAMDTFKDQQVLERMHAQGEAPWQVWRRPPARHARRRLIGMLVIGERGLTLSRMLCISAHSDDLEIGCGGTVLALLERQPGMMVDWLVLSADGERAHEARASADRFLSGASERRVTVESFRERYFPYDAQLKEYFDRLGTPAGTGSRPGPVAGRRAPGSPHGLRSSPPTRFATS